MEALFRKYLAPNSKFLDMACGTGDCLVLASLCQPQCDIWGLDIHRASLDIARQRMPNATVLEGNMLSPDSHPKGHFDVVHEFGATFFVRRWDALVKVYFSLLREGGVLLWELPQKWSTTHISYMLAVAGFWLTCWLHEAIRIVGYGFAHFVQPSRRDEALFKFKKSWHCLLWLIGCGMLDGANDS